MITIEEAIDFYADRRGVEAKHFIFFVEFVPTSIGNM
jgi:hypothetical protein